MTRYVQGLRLWTAVSGLNALIEIVELHYAIGCKPKILISLYAVTAMFWATCCGFYYGWQREQWAREA